MGKWFLCEGCAVVRISSILLLLTMKQLHQWGRKKTSCGEKAEGGLNAF